VTGGGREVAEAVSGLGGAIAAIGEKFQQAKDMTDMTESETMILAQFDQLKDNYARDTDYSTMLSRWSKDADKIPESLKKNVSGRVKKAREALYSKYRLQYAVEINDTARGKQISDGRAKHDEGLDMILRTGGRFAPDRAEALIRGTAAAGYISAEEAQRDRARILPEIDFYSAYDMIEVQPEDVDEIVKLHPDLNPDMKIQLRRFAEGRIAKVKSEQEIQFDKAKATFESDWLAKYARKQLMDIREIQSANFGVTDPELISESIDVKNEWIGKAERQMAAIAAGKKDPAEEFNPKVYADLTKRILDNPSAVLDNDIINPIGKGVESGITATQGTTLMGLKNRLVDRDKTEDPVTRNMLSRAHSILKAYYNAGLWGDLEDTKEGKEAAMIWSEKAYQVDRFFQATEKPTFKEFEDFFESLTKDAERGFWNKLGKLFLMSSPLYQVGKIGKTIWDIRKVEGEIARKRKLKALGDEQQLGVLARGMGDIEIVDRERWVLIKRGDTPAEDIWQKQ